MPSPDGPAARSLASPGPRVRSSGKGRSCLGPAHLPSCSRALSGGRPPFSAVSHCCAFRLRVALRSSRRTGSPSPRPPARQRRESFLPASDARPSRLAAPRVLHESRSLLSRGPSHARRAMRAADVCFPLLDYEHPCLVGSRRRLTKPFDLVRAGGPGASRHLVRFGGSRSSSVSTHRGIFSLPRAPRDRTSGISQPHARFLAECTHTTWTASARTPREGVRARRPEMPSAAGEPRPPSERPCGPRSSTPSFFVARAFVCSRSVSCRRFALASPRSTASLRMRGAARRELGPVCAIPRSVRKRRRGAFLDRRRRPTTSAT